MALDKSDLYEMLYTEEEDRIIEKYQSLPAATSDIDIDITDQGTNGEILLDYEDRAIYVDPEVLYQPKEEVRAAIGHGIKHLKWHPNHAWNRTDLFNQRTFSGSSTVEDYTTTMMGETVEDMDVEAAVRDIYRNAVNAFSDILETEFTAPDLHLNYMVEEDMENPPEFIDHPERVGYSIEHENDMIVLSRDIAGDLQPELLNEDFRHMLKRYHDLSLEKAVRQKVTPYVEGLRPNSETDIEKVVFSNLEEGVGSYEQVKDKLTVDYSYLKHFNPQTNSFEPVSEGLPGSAILLHEGVHALDFATNEKTVQYLHTLPDTDIDDPRNAVFESPTTFEVMMAGKSTRGEALQAFENPLQNIEFFEDYPADLQNATSSEPDSITDPYNMGLFTSLSIHHALIQDKGLEEGTRLTRDILYENGWDLEHMGKMMERAFSQRNIPNIPRHRRETMQIAEKGEEATIEEAASILEGLEESESAYETLDNVVRGRQLVNEYEERHGFSNPPEEVWQLDGEVFETSYKLEQLPDTER